MDCFLVAVLGLHNYSHGSFLTGDQFRALCIGCFFLERSDILFGFAGVRPRSFD